MLYFNVCFSSNNFNQTFTNTKFIPFYILFETIWVPVFIIAIWQGNETQKMNTGLCFSLYKTIGFFLPLVALIYIQHYRLTNFTYYIVLYFQITPNRWSHKLLWPACIMTLILKITPTETISLTTKQHIKPQIAPITEWDYRDSAHIIF